MDIQRGFQHGGSARATLLVLTRVVDEMNSRVGAAAQLFNKLERDVHILRRVLVRPRGSLRHRVDDDKIDLRALGVDFRDQLFDFLLLHEIRGSRDDFEIFPQLLHVDPVM